MTDFGIARSGASQMTEAGSIVGTAQYLSPEQARGAPVDPRSDLYSLGIVLYEMLTGKVPFTGDAPVEIAMKHLSAIPEPPSTLRPEVPHELDAVVMRALAKDPDQRYRSAEEMDADLARVARGVAVSPRTEEAMTQVLAGAGIAAAATTVRRRAPSRRRPPPPPPPPCPHRAAGLPAVTTTTASRRAAARRGRGSSALLAVVIAASAGYLLYQKIQTQLDKQQAGRRRRRRLLRQEDLATQKLDRRGLPGGDEGASRATIVAKGSVDRARTRLRGDRGREGLDRDDHRLDGQAEGRRVPAAQGLHARPGDLDARRAPG